MSPAKPILVIPVTTGSLCRDFIQNPGQKTHFPQAWTSLIDKLGPVNRQLQIHWRRFSAPNNSTPQFRTFWDLREPTKAYKGRPAFEGLIHRPGPNLADSGDADVASAWRRGHGARCPTETHVASDHRVAVWTETFQKTGNLRQGSAEVLPSRYLENRRGVGAPNKYLALAPV